MLEKDVPEGGTIPWLFPQHLTKNLQPVNLGSYTIYNSRAIDAAIWCILKISKEYSTAMIWGLSHIRTCGL